MLHTKIAAHAFKCMCLMFSKMWMCLEKTSFFSLSQGLWNGLFLRKCTVAKRSTGFHVLISWGLLSHHLGPEFYYARLLLQTNALLLKLDFKVGICRSNYFTFFISRLIKNMFMLCFQIKLIKLVC